MLNKNQERELAYIVTVNDVTNMEGYDSLELAHINGWTCVVGKGEFKPGDRGVYFEIDSKLPENEPFTLSPAIVKYKYKIKTQKFSRGGIKYLSQGLLMPLNLFNERVIKNASEGIFLTASLGVTYYEPEDNSRKDNNALKIAKINNAIEKFKKKHPIFSKFPFVLAIYRRRLYKIAFKKKKIKKSDWPDWVKKTDEERCQNMPWLFTDEYRNKHWIATEKIDGTSTTFTMKQKDRKLIVCSRNVVFDKPKKEDKNFYKDTDGNVYLEMAEKYCIEEFCNRVLSSEKDLEYITIQGETYGGNIQKRKYGDEHKLAIFNVILKYEDKDAVRLHPLEMKLFIDDFNHKYHFQIDTVPILDVDFKIPETCEKLLETAEGDSAIDGNPREGLVIRNADESVNTLSFKAVSNSFLEKYHN